MTTALWLLAALGTIGAFDTLYYHEWRARLPAWVPRSAPELRLHAVRDFLYAVLFGTLPWLEWQGLWSIVLTTVLLTEIVLTLVDFVVEIRVRKPLGDVYGGERVTHAVMGILYGAMVTNLLPSLWHWWCLPTAMAASQVAVPPLLQVALPFMAAGVCLSGVRDWYAAVGLPHGSWPWKRSLPEEKSRP
jgi:hypothetical protein